MKRLRLFTTILLLAFLITSCGDRKESTSDDKRLDRAMALIDRGEYTQAIAELEILMQQTPNFKVREVLASAYAGRAGVMVQNIWGMAVGYEALLKQEKNRKKPSELSMDLPRQSLDPELRAVVEKVEAQIQEYNDIRKRVELIPYLPLSRRADLNRAVEVLTGAPTPGASLYRALLGLVLLRSSVQDTVEAALIWQKKGFPLCNPQVQILQTWIRFSGRIAEEVVLDLGKAYPEKMGDALRAHENLKGWRRPLQILKKATQQASCTNAG